MKASVRPGDGAKREPKPSAFALPASMGEQPGMAPRRREDKTERRADEISREDPRLRTSLDGELRAAKIGRVDGDGDGAAGAPPGGGSGSAAGTTAGGGSGGAAGGTRGAGAPGGSTRGTSKKSKGKRKSHDRRDADRRQAGGADGDGGVGLSL